MKPLLPEHLIYQGWFGLPDRRGRPAIERYGYGGAAMAYDVESESLFVAGHIHHGFVGQILPAPPGERAVEITPPFDPAPDTLHQERLDKRLDRLGGIAVRDGMLYSSWFRYYGVEPTTQLAKETLAAIDLRDAAAWPALKRIGPDVPPFSQKSTSGYMCEIPKDWAEANGIPTQTLACGRGDGAGNATSPRGPALFAVNPISPEKATTLLYRGPDQPPLGWTACDQWSGAAWVRAGDYEAVVFLGEVAVEPTWYGAPDMPDERPDWFTWTGTYFGGWQAAWQAAGHRDVWRPGRGEKGNHTTRREVRLQAYRTVDLAMVAKGEFEQWDVGVDFGETLDVFHEASSPGACAYDPAGRRVFAWESYPPEDGMDGYYKHEDPRIHVWKVDVPEESEPEPEPPSQNREIIVTFPEDERPVRYDNTLEGRLELIHDVSDRSL